MSLFTPFDGLLGGALIGLAADVLLLLNGDILGASGIVSTVFLNPIKSLTEPSQHWKVVFLAGFTSTTVLFLAPRFHEHVSTVENARALSPMGLAVAGAFVGFGTKLGNGCTSGHGICGLARMSRRSLVAVVTFMMTGILTTIGTSKTSRLSHVSEFLRATGSDVGSQSPTDSLVGWYLSGALVISALVSPYLQRKAGTQDDRAKLVPAGIAGSLFAVGLLVSKMVMQGKVLGFLDLSLVKIGKWDPTLMFVMGGGLVVSFLGYQWKKKLQQPICLCKESQFSIPSISVIDWQLVMGAACFGVGWGIAGYCPGPAMFLAAAGAPCILPTWWPGFMVGSYLASEIKNSGSC